MKALTGNWIGAAVVAAVTMSSAFVLALVYVGIQLDDQWKIGGMVKNAANLTFATFGVPLDVSSDGDHASATSAPLLITLVSTALGVLVFLRVVRRYPDKLDAVWDALRTAVAVGAFFTVTAVVLKIVNPSLALMSSGDGPSPGAPLNGFSDVQVVPSIAGAIFIPASAAAVLLTVAVLRSSLPSSNRLATLASAISRPAITGLRVLVWATVPAGLVQMLSIQTSQDGVHNLETISRQIFTLPNQGVATLGTGVGAPFGVRGTGFGDEVGRLGMLADELNWVMWLSIPVALLTVSIAAYLVARTADRDGALWSVGTYLIGLLIVLPLLGVLANASVEARIDGENSTWRTGVDITEMTFTLWGASILASLVALLLVGKLTLAKLQARPDA